jgi:hypothetical protein
MQWQVPQPIRPGHLAPKAVHCFYGVEGRAEYSFLLISTLSVTKAHLGCCRKLKQRETDHLGGGFDLSAIYDDHSNRNPRRLCEWDLINDQCVCCEDMMHTAIATDFLLSLVVPGSSPGCPPDVRPSNGF